MSDDFKCVGCGEVSKVDDVDSYHSELTDETYCYGCYESDLEHASQLILIHGDTNKVRFGDYFAIDDDHEIPAWFTELYDKWDGREYVKTDGWRGHYDTEKKFKGIKTLATGWTTGWADETTQRKAHFNAWAESLAEGSIPTPYPIYFLTEPTSNVFSMSMSVLCKEKDFENVNNWLNETDAPVSLLQQQLS
jgi:hypothetical protein